MPVADAEAPRPAFRHGAGILAGAALLALVHAAAVAIWVPLPAAGIGLRLSHHLFDAVETLGLGALAGAIVAAVARFARVPRWAAVIAAAAATGAVLHLAVGDYVRQLAAMTFEGRHEAPLHAAYTALVSFVLPVAYLAGSAVSGRPRLRVAAVALGVAAIVAGQIPLRDGYFGLHCALAWSAATFAGAALAKVAERTLLPLRARPRAVAALAAVLVLGIVVPPPNATRVELFRQPAAIAEWALATVLWRSPALHAPLPVPASPWLADRSALAPVPPTTPRLLPESPVVVLVSIDAVRAEAVNDPANDRLFPTLAEMKRAGVHFTNVTAPASQTVLSLSTAFTGRYASQLQWALHGRGSRRYTFPRDDPSPRFPRILSEHGVDTLHNASVSFLSDEYGVVRGFSEGKVLVKGRRHARARELVDPLIERLERVGAEPLFLYAHLTEPHDPYDRGRKDGTDYERYLSEIAVADKHLARLVRALSRLGDRWALVVTSDHGEAFGDHETFDHGKTLYQELVHVPLLAMGPRLKPRVIVQRVGLVDLGPTMLDLFGLDTPAPFMGQSLVPLLAGKEATLARPLISEGKLRRALTTPDGLKVIDDPRRKLVEVYDLTRDPGETRNLFDVEPARADAALAILRAFVAAQTRGGEYQQDGEL